jgi:hypothetical protein
MKYYTVGEQEGQECSSWLEAAAASQPPLRRNFLDLATLFLDINVYVWYVIYLNVKEGVTYIRNGGLR